MLFAFHLLDRDNTAALRAELRPQHKAYLANVAEKIAFAGPLLADDGKTMIGSLLVIDFPDRTAAVQWQSAEPFSQAGLYATHSVLAFSNLWVQKAGFPPSGH